MMLRNKRKSAKEKLNIVKKFLSGEDVVKDIFNGIEPITAMIIIDHASGEVIEKIGFGIGSNGKAFQWKETKTYPDPEIEGIRYQNPANLPEIGEIGNTELSVNIESIENKASNEPTKALSKQARINAKKLEAEHIMQISKARRDRMNEFTAMNSEFIRSWR